MDKEINRRKFIAMVAGAGTVIASSCGSTKKTGEKRFLGELADKAVVPRRPFGRAGVSVSKLAFGGASVMGTDGQQLLDEALRLGIDCWEFTSFTGGVFGEYFRGHPGARDRVFLSAKTKSTDPAVMQEQLNDALSKNRTSVIDFFAVHGVEDVGVLDDNVRRWAEKAKGEGAIRFFGFCTHKKVDSCLNQAARLGWIDGIQAFYNYRTRSIESTRDAVRECHESGKGIFAIKSMGLCVKKNADIPGLAASKDELISRLARHGMSFEQAKLRALWQDPNLTSICSLMPSAEIIQANAAAAMDERPMDAEITRSLTNYAEKTGMYFCRRCGACDDTAPDGIPVFNVMESLMYSRAYGAKDWASKIFLQIPAEIREKMQGADYSKAESMCPQKMPIAQLMKEAYLELNG